MHIFQYAESDSSENEEEAAYFLVLSGGAFRGSFQFWVIADLLERFFFQHMSGVSIGAGNVSFAAMHKLSDLVRLWESLDGFGGFLRLRVAYLVGFATGVVFFLNKLGASILPGIYSMDPYKARLSEHVKLRDVKVPFSVGVVSVQGGKELYHDISSAHVTSNEQMVTAIQASGTMVPLMMPPILRVPGVEGAEVCADGGYWNIFPIPSREIEKAKADGKKIIIMAVGCTPLDRVKRVRRKKVMGLFGMTMRLIEIMEAAVYDGDILQLRLAAGIGGEVHLYVPSIEPGDSFDASKEQCRRRLEESRRMVEAGPIVYKGLGEL